VTGVEMCGVAILPIAIMQSLGRITMLQLNGVLSPGEFKSALSLAISSINKIYELQKEALRRKYLTIEE